MREPHFHGSVMLPMRTRLAWPAALLLSSLGARAETGIADFPDKPVRWIVPTSAGAGTDAAARSFAKVAGDAWKQSVVVDNRSGASGMIGLAALAAAPPDGYTLGFMSVSQFLDATLQEKYVFEAQKDLTPISQLASTPLLLTVNASTGIENLGQLIARAKAQPGSLNYASGGAGGLTHFAMELFLQRAGIKMLHVPYKGSGPAIQDLLAGQVQLAFSTPPAVTQHIKSGRLRALATASATRSLLTPEVPTFAELGLTGVVVSTWYGLFGPANVAPELVGKIARSIAATARTPAVREKMERDGLEQVLDTPSEFAKFLRTDRQQWLDVAKAIQFKRES